MVVVVWVVAVVLGVSEWGVLDVGIMDFVGRGEEFH